MWMWNKWMFASFSHYIHFFIHFRMTFYSWLYTILDEKKDQLDIFSTFPSLTPPLPGIALSQPATTSFSHWKTWHSLLSPGWSEKNKMKYFPSESPSGENFTAVLRFSASACLLLIVSWLISTCWSSSLLNLMGGCFLIKLASPSSPGTVNARDFSRTFPELEEEEEEVLDWELSDRFSSVVESFPLTVPGKSLWFRVSASSVRF